MATNRKNEDGNRLYLEVGSGVSSGDPIVVGQIPGVALYDADSSNKAVIQTDGVFDLTAEAVDNAGNSAIAVGDILYYDSAATIKINKDVTNGVRFGYAKEAVTAGSSGTIEVVIGY